MMDDVPDMFGEKYRKNNTYVAPNLLTRSEILDILSGIYGQLEDVKKNSKLSRGDRIYFDVRGIIEDAQDRLQGKIDEVYNDG